METNIVVCLLIGLPGAGKSTLAKLLKSTTCEILADVKIIHISFDDFVSISEQKSLAYDALNKEGSSKETPFRDKRQQFLDILVNLIISIRNCRSDSSSKSFLEDIVLEKDNHYVLIVDDNFYYKSMRYKYYQLARDYQCGFCQIYLQCDIALARMRNNNRALKVPSRVIEVMSKRLEEPNSNKLTWEADSMVIPSSNTCLEPFLESIWCLFQKCLHNGLSAIEDRTEDAAAAQQLCLASVLHRADLLLRTLITAKMKFFKDGSNKQNGQTVLTANANKMNSVRKDILMGLKTKRLKVPENIWKNEMIEEKKLEQFLKIEFENFMSQNM